MSLRKGNFPDKKFQVHLEKNVPSRSPVLTTQDFKGGSYKGLVNPIFKSLETLIFLYLHRPFITAL